MKTLTCNRPLSSLSPRSFTKTISSKERRTKSRGSDTGAASPSPMSAILKCLWRFGVDVWQKTVSKIRRAVLLTKSFDPHKFRNANSDTNETFLSASHQFTQPQHTGLLNAIMITSETNVDNSFQGVKASVTNTIGQAPEQDRATTVHTKDRNHRSAQDNSKGQNDTKADKLSGAALKKKAKEEKAAKRALEKEKQNQQQPANDASARSKPEAFNDTSRKSATPSNKEAHTPKQQHKKTGSISTNQSNPLALRQVEVKATSLPLPVHKENKHVALFGHLYGNPRRTTIAGAGKDVHPAVLALGLQMSNYVICGSNARCVATLLVFKRVGVFRERLCFMPNLCIGYRIIYNTASEFVTAPLDYPPFFPDRLPCLVSTALCIYGQCYSMAQTRNRRG